jgi:methylmalonyl-CoA decarboxylase
MASQVIAALESLRARQVRAIVLRAAPGMDVWSAGHDIGELPPGKRDPLGYDDPLEELIRAIRTFPAPVVAMVHGTVWGGALDLVLSCDLAVADETASFAITPANLGLPYNITGLLHFQGRLPINVIKEMFFTAAPIDARKAREWLLINHLVTWDRLETFTLELAATMATKSPLAIAVIKEQLRVLSDYQPTAAQVYERVQGLRREAYDSSDSPASPGQPIFRGPSPLPGSFTPALSIRHPHEPPEPGDSQRLARQLPDARLIRTRTFAELWVYPARLTTEISDFLDHVWRMTNHRTAAKPGREPTADPWVVMARSASGLRSGSASTMDESWRAGP